MVGLAPNAVVSPVPQLNRRRKVSRVSCVPKVATVGCSRTRAVRCRATPFVSQRWLPRNRRTLSPVANRRAVTEGGPCGAGSERERCAVQQAVQPAALRRVTPLACASGPPRLARRSTAPLDGPERAQHRGRANPKMIVMRGRRRWGALALLVTSNGWLAAGDPPASHSEFGKQIVEREKIAPPTCRAC
jgi:hypothetical protein